MHGYVPHVGAGVPLYLEVAVGLEVGVELVGRGLHLVHRLFDRVVDIGVRFGRRVGGTAVTPVTGRPPGPRGEGGYG